tara:strand:- start:630 stop:1178 length:549 start_codon:yes stop_codon:yes gene_type:complete
MNIFVVDQDPRIAAQSLCDKHVVKMILESGQMLSTAHRMLDGNEYIGPSKSGKRQVKKYSMNDEREFVLYNVVHANHPCTVWTMESSSNYAWHFIHFEALAKEYQFRYGKTHSTWDKLRDAVSSCPRNIPSGPRTPFAIAMKHYPQCIVENDPVESYRKYYNEAKASFAKWTKRAIPEWYHV